MNKDKRILYVASLLALILGINYFAGAKSTYKFLLLVFASIFLYQFSVYKISFGKPKIMDKTSKDNEGFCKDFGLDPKIYENPSKTIKELPKISGGRTESKTENSKGGINQINPFSNNGLV